MRFLAAGWLVLALTSLAGTRLQAQTVIPTGFSVSTVSSDLSGDVVAFTRLPDGRFLTANQFSGTIELVVSGTATQIATVVNLRTSGPERGLLAIANDPHWPDSNYIYVYYTMGDGTSRALRYTAGGDLSDGTSNTLTLATATPDTLVEMIDAAFNHNGGSLRFGSDRTLYVSLGDDADVDSVQTLTRLHGKILRISPDPGRSLPTPNPTFPSAPAGAIDDIFAIGLRNPFRFAVDPKTDRLLIGDVGQSDYEEVSLSEGGENFGWPRYEGNSMFSNAATIPPAVTFPIHDYEHASGSQNSVIALLTYRPVDYPNDSSFPPEYDGAHFFADFFYGPIWSLMPDGQGGWAVDTFATGFTAPVDAAPSPNGGFYLLEQGGDLYEISYDPGSVVTLDATVFLEGPYQDGAMDTTLLDDGHLPLFQPYADPAFDNTPLEYDASVDVDALPRGVVDWVLAEVRSDSSADSTVSTQLGFVTYDGSVVATDGSAGIAFPMVDSASYYVVIRHRNHASVATPTELDFSSGSASWDFTTAMTQALSVTRSPMADLGGGAFGMFAGDGDASQDVAIGDFALWLVDGKAAATGYLQSDFDLDGEADITDFALWLANAKSAAESQVPDP